MATARSNLPKEMTPFGKGAKKVNPFGDKGKAPPFGGKAPAPPFGKEPPFGKAPPFGKVDEPPAKGKGKKPPSFAVGGIVSGDMAAPGTLRPSTNPIDDGKPSGGGMARGGGIATKGKRFQGTF